MLGVFHRDGIGDIDLVWGDKGGGLYHILSKHVGDGKSFATVEEAIAEIEKIITNGKQDFENGDRIVFKIGEKQVTIRKNFREKGKKIADKNWVLTAYDETSADSGSPAATIQGQAGKTTDISNGKDTKKNATDKKNVANSTESEQKNYTITPAQYTTKRNKVLDMHLVTFGRELTKDELAAGKEIAKQNRGWYDRDRGGFMMRDEESAKQLAEALNDKEKVADEQPLTLADVVESNPTETKQKQQPDKINEYRQQEQLSYEREKRSFYDNETFLTAGTENAEQKKNILLAELDKYIQGYEKVLKNSRSRSEAKKAEYAGALRAFYELKKEIEKKYNTQPSETKDDDTTAPEQYIEEQGQPKQEEKKAKSKWVDDEDAARFEELRQKLKKKLGGQLNLGLDPEAFAAGVEMSYLMLEHGARKFADFAKEMIEALGEAVRPYLKSFYNGARDLPEMERYAKELTPYDEVYGYTLDGKIYIDPRIATAETPVHEYGHLWAQALRAANPEAWERLKGEMFKQKDVADYVRRKYPELKTDDEIAEEIFTHYGGKRGAERLRAEMQAEMDKAADPITKARIATVFHRIRELLDKFWNMARDMFANRMKSEDIAKLTAEDFADMMMSDLMRGFDPRAERSENNDIRWQKAGEQDIETINNRFNEELQRYEKGELPKGHRFDLGHPSEYLRSAGFDDLPISMRASLLGKKAGEEKHPFEISEVKDMVKAIQKPIAILHYTKDNMRNLIVDVKHGDKHFLVGVTLNYDADGIEINSVSGLFPKESHEWIKWIQDGKAIRIDQKEKVQDLINSLQTNPAEAERIGLNLNQVAKIVHNFENPKLYFQSAENETNTNTDTTPLYRTSEELGEENTPASTPEAKRETAEQVAESGRR